MAAAGAAFFVAAGVVALLAGVAAAGAAAAGAATGVLDFMAGAAVWAKAEPDRATRTARVTLAGANFMNDSGVVKK